jgi:predicted small secreted protein
MFERQDCVPTRPGPISWLLGVLAAGLLVLSVNGCNTVSGMGKDVSAAGHAVSHTAQKTEDKID